MTSYSPETKPGNKERKKGKAVCLVTMRSSQSKHIIASNRKFPPPFSSNPK